MSVLSRAGQDVAETLRRHPVIPLIPISILVGLALGVAESPILVGAALALVPVVILQVVFTRNLFLGITAYLVVEYLQPGYRIPALASVRPALLVACSLLLAWILNAMQHRVKLVLNWQVKAYLIFFLLAAGSAYSAISVGMVGQTVIIMAKTLAVFFIMYSVVNTVVRLERLIRLYIFLHLILGLLALMLFFTTGERQLGDLGASFLGDENDSAMALLIMIPYSYFMLVRTPSRLLRVGMTVSMLVSSAAVLFSFSRGAFIGFSAMCAHVWAQSERRRVATVLLPTVLVGLFAIMPEAYWERIESVKDYSTEGSAQGRIDAWKGGIGMMLDSPLFGAGLGNFNRTYGTEYNTINTRWTAAHSMYIQFIGELGVPGLLFITTVIFLTFRTFRRVRASCRDRTEPEYKMLNTIVRASESGFVAYLVATVFLNSMSHPHLWHFGAISGCARLALEDLRRRDQENQRLNVVIPEEAAELP